MQKTIIQRSMKTVSVDQVSKDTGVPYGSVCDILNGRTMGIPLYHVKKIMEYRERSGNLIESNIATLEPEVRRRYFAAEQSLRQFLHNKYQKYHNKPVQLKTGIYPNMETRVGFYERYSMPIFINDARIHNVYFGGEAYCLCEYEFTIHKKKIKDRDGEFTHWVDVKCPHCTHTGLYNMRYLVCGYNCEICHGAVSVNDRVRKVKFNMGDFR